MNAAAGLGIGSGFDPTTLTSATSASQAETSRVNSGLGVGGGSQTDYTNVTASSTEAVDESDRNDGVGGNTGIGGGSQGNL